MAWYEIWEKGRKCVGSVRKRAAATAGVTARILWQKPGETLGLRAGPLWAAHSVVFIPRTYSYIYYSSLSLPGGGDFSAPLRVPDIATSGVSRWVAYGFICRWGMCGHFWGRPFASSSIMVLQCFFFFFYIRACSGCGAQEADS